MFYLKNKCYVTRWIGILSFIYIAHVFGCASLQVNKGVFSPPHRNYTITLPGKDWETARTGKEDIALWHTQHHAMIIIMSGTTEDRKVSPDELSRQLFIGMKNKEILLNESVLVDNRTAMHTILTCEIDKHKLKVESYVIKSGNRVCDIVSWSSPDLFDYTRKDFENIIKSFKFSNL